jgi:hypothetical protein
MDVSLKEMASFNLIKAGNVTIINKGRTREFASEIIVVERQPICRMKNDKQA